MEGITLFVFIVIIVFGVLQIILFFKLWGMTSNVKRIKDNIINGTDVSFESAKKELLAGNSDKAFEIYNRCFINDIFVIYKEVTAGEMSDKYITEEYISKYQDKCNLYKKELSKLGGNYSIDFSRFDTVDKLRSILS
ncbi:hypothetical protein [Bacteroides xylanisolvens]|jgi:hypothetical protein|uniref:hypothetical protein n=1 Tax=Bacteroides xylanisolvens TaxID=371601 RepID=UPI0039B6734B